MPNNIIPNLPNTPTTNHNQNIGKQGEALAAAYLLKNNYQILEKNWRHSNMEVDIIAFKNKILHVIEVKTRTSKTYGAPEDDVTVKKFRLLQDAAEVYMYKHPEYNKLQFDIIAITMYANEPVAVNLIEDYYF